MCISCRSFLSDKYEHQYFYWEMVIVSRKVLLQAVFLLFNPTVSVLLATGVTMASLVIHVVSIQFIYLLHLRHVTKIADVHAIRPHALSKTPALIGQSFSH